MSPHRRAALFLVFAFTTAAQVDNDTNATTTTTTSTTGNFTETTMPSATASAAPPSRGANAPYSATENFTTTATSTATSTTPSTTSSAMLETIRVNFTVSGVDYYQLEANATLLADFEAATKEAIAARLGINASAVLLTLSPGSVAVEAALSLPAGSYNSALNTLRSSTAEISSDIEASLAAVPGIYDVAQGPINVVPPFQILTTPLTSTTMQMGYIASGAFSISAAGAWALLLTAYAAAAA